MSIDPQMSLEELRAKAEEILDADYMIELNNRTFEKDTYNA